MSADTGDLTLDEAIEAERQARARCDAAAAAYSAYFKRHPTRSTNRHLAGKAEDALDAVYAAQAVVAELQGTSCPHCDRPGLYKGIQEDECFIEHRRA